MSAVLCGIEQVGLSFRTLPVTGTKLLIFLQNVELDLDLNVCGFLSTELRCSCARMGKSQDENDNKYRYQ